MGQVLDLQAARAARTPLVEKPTVSRTPELAFILAIVAGMPRRERNRVFGKVLSMAEACPDCETSQEAGQLALSLLDFFEGAS